MSTEKVTVSFEISKKKLDLIVENQAILTSGQSRPVVLKKLVNFHKKNMNIIAEMCDEGFMLEGPSPVGVYAVNTPIGGFIATLTAPKFEINQ